MNTTRRGAGLLTRCGARLARARSRSRTARSAVSGRRGSRRSRETSPGCNTSPHSLQPHLDHAAGRLSRNFPDKSTMAIRASPAARLHVAAGWPVKTLRDVEHEAALGGKAQDQPCRDQRGGRELIGVVDVVTRQKRRETLKTGGPTGSLNSQRTLRC